ncbi:hypothetical protein AKO1_007143 [Acrasis kona]|uniref:Prolyl endopeptidase n=1 Tax=Acrasis kona TaxID=1008807 RepID=A0AAW2YTR6_9EUKA
MVYTRRVAILFILAVLFIGYVVAFDDFESVLDYDTMNVEGSYIPEQDESAETLSFVEDLKKAFQGKIFKAPASIKPTQRVKVEAGKDKKDKKSADSDAKKPKGTKSGKKKIYRKESSVEDTWKMLKPLFGLVGIGGASFHPYKNELIYVSNEPGVLQIYRTKYDRNKKIAGKPQRLVTTKNRCSAPRYLFDGSILYLHDRGGNENFQIGMITNKDKHVWLTDNLKAKHLINTVTKNHMYYQTNSRDKKKFDIYRRSFPLESSHATNELIYTPDEGIARASLVSSDETKIILSQHYSNVHSEILLLDLIDKTVKSLTKPLSGDAHYRWQPVKFLNKQHTKLLVKTDFQGEFLRLAIIEFDNDIKNDKPVFRTIPAMERIKHDVTGMTSNYRTKFSYIELNKNGYSELIRVRVRENGFKHVDTMALPLRKGVIAHGDARSFGHGMSIAKDGHLMAISMTSSQHPVNLYMLNLSHKRASQPRRLRKQNKNATVAKYWTLFPDRLPKQVLGVNFIQETSHFFKSFDGTPIQYFLFKPDTKPPEDGFPVIVKLHGGPESQSRPTFNAITQFLVKSGFAVAYPNIRGSRGYGKKFLDADNQDKRLDAIHDVKMTAMHVGNKKNMNAGRLVVMGGSYGGYATQLSVVTYPELWKAGVSVVGMSNLETFFKHTAEWRRRLRYQEYGNYHTQIDLLRKISPINHVEKIKCPLFIIQGENDERVPVSEARQMYERLKQVGKEAGKQRVTKSVLLTFPDEGHGLSKKANREKAYKKLMTWLKEIV